MLHNDIISLLFSRHLEVCNNRLSYSDMKRVAKNIRVNPFGRGCCLWYGYVTNSSNPKKGNYINFYYRGKKRALHRLMYENYIGNLEDTEYLKFTCSNPGRCINVTHMKKSKYKRIKNHSKSTRTVKKPPHNVKNISFTVRFD